MEYVSNLSSPCEIRLCTIQRLAALVMENISLVTLVFVTKYKIVASKVADNLLKVQN